MKFERRHTDPSSDPLDDVTYVQRSTVINDQDGSEVFRLDDFDVPEDWSQLATDIVASKYFRKRGVPKTGHETSVRQVILRLAHTIRTAGEAGGYFDSASDAEPFEAELAYHLVHQMGRSTRRSGSTAGFTRNTTSGRATAVITIGTTCASACCRRRTLTRIRSVRRVTSSPSKTI